MRASSEFIQSAIDEVEGLSIFTPNLHTEIGIAHWMIIDGEPLIEKFIQDYRNLRPENAEMPMPDVRAVTGSPYCGKYDEDRNRILIDVTNLVSSVHEKLGFKSPEGKDPAAWKRMLYKHVAAYVISVLIHESIHAIQFYAGRSRKYLMEMDQDLYPYELREIEVCAHAFCCAMMWAAIAPRKVYRTRRLGDLALYIYRQNLVHMVSEDHLMRLFIPEVSGPFRQILTDQLTENLMNSGLSKPRDAVQGMIQDRRDLFERQYRRYSGWWQLLNERCHPVTDRT